MESTSTECDCSTKLKEQHEEMKACYEQLDKEVCAIGQKSLQSIRRVLEESESVKSQVGKKYQELYAKFSNLQTNYDKLKAEVCVLKAEKEELGKRNNRDIEIMTERLTAHGNHIKSFIQKMKDKERDIESLTKKVKDNERDVEILRQTLTGKGEDIDVLTKKVKDKERDIESLTKQVKYREKDIDLLK